MSDEAKHRWTTYKVNQRADVLVDRHVRPSCKLLVRRQPRRKRRVRQDKLALRQLLPQRLRECRHPFLRSAVTLVHRRQVLVIDVDPVQLVVKDKLGHRVRGADGVRSRGSGLVGLAEGRGDNLDTRLSVFSLLRCLLGSR